MSYVEKYVGGILFTAVLAVLSGFLSGLIPYHLIGPGRNR